jgi:hypothetical protein
MRDAHQVSIKRDVFAFAVYSPGEEDGINYFSSERCLGGAAEILLLAGPSDRSAKNVVASFAGLIVKQCGPFTIGTKMVLVPPSTVWAAYAPLLNHHNVRSRRRLFIGRSLKNARFVSAWWRGFIESNMSCCMNRIQLSSAIHDVSS